MTYPILPGAEPWSSPGEGETARTGVVVLHGFTGNPNSTRPLGEALAADGYAVEVPRLPGHGTHWRDMARTRYRDWRAAAAEVVDGLRRRCDQVVLVGLSMGGTIALDLASADPDRIAGVVAINPQLLDPTQPLARLAPVLQYLVPVLPRDLAGLPSNDIAKPGADERAYRMVPSKAAYSLIAELPRIRAKLQDLTVPVLVAVSEQDHTVPPANGRALERLAPRAEVTVLSLPRSYHVATLDYDAELLTEEIRRFIRRVAG